LAARHPLQHGIEHQRRRRFVGLQQLLEGMLGLRQPGIS
jgi:hypothetical protein